MLDFSYAHFWLVGERWEQWPKVLSVTPWVWMPPPTDDWFAGVLQRNTMSVMFDPTPSSLYLVTSVTNV